MKAGIMVAIVACLACSISIAAQGPGPGAPEHAVHIAPVSSVVLRPCVSVRGNQARILLPRNQLMELSQRGKRSFQNEEERIAFIAGDRARALLATATGEMDASGCEMVDLAKADPMSGSVYLVGQLIESGEATVIRDGADKAETSITVRDYNGAVAGFRSFGFADGDTFLMYQTWVS